MKKKKKKKMLIAEDDALLLKVYETFFSNANFEVCLAENGLDALDLIKANDYDIVFTDYSMPILNGVELIAKCQFLAKKLPIFILNIDRSDFKKIGNAPKFFSVLSKGTDAVTLLEKVKNSIVKKHLVHELHMMQLFEVGQLLLSDEELCITPPPVCYL